MIILKVFIMLPAETVKVIVKKGLQFTCGYAIVLFKIYNIGY